MKVTLIRTGGTIGSAAKAGVIAPDLNASVPHLDCFDLKSVSPFYELSERLDCDHYAKLLSCVKEEISACQAIVITHGTDTLPFTAAVIAFGLGKVTKPVVFVSSDKPLEEDDASGHCSLKTAAAFIKTKQSGIYVADGDNVHYGVRLLEARAFDGKYFSALDKIKAVRINEKMLIVDKDVKSSDNFLNKLMKKNIICIKPHPGLDYTKIDVSSADAVLHDTYHSGTLNEKEVNEFSEKVSAPMFVVGGTKDKVYASKAAFGKRLKVLDNITFAAAYGKLLVGLNRFSNKEALEQYMRTIVLQEYFL